MTESEGRYVSYLLRLWETAGSDGGVCRASLENAHSSERVGFASLDALFDYLRTRAGREPEAQGGPNDDQEGGEPLKDN